MKRLIKFWNQYDNDLGQFSDCSTHYEVLSVLVDDKAGPKQLKAIAKQLGIRTKGEAKKSKAPRYRHGKNEITHFIKTTKKTEPQYHAKKRFEWFLGFITLKEGGTLEPVEKIGKLITEDQANNIINNREYGLSDVGHFDIGKEKEEARIIMNDWSYYHQIKLLGYDQDKFERMITGHNKSQDGEREFDDAVFNCSECGIWDHNDSGYTYNYSIIDGMQLGINCGCHSEYCKKNFLDFVDNTDTPMELESAEELGKEGIIRHLERFIGGMTDGRGGYFKGQETREGTPIGVLQEYQEKFPKAKFLFTHDESGQFQSYFSIWLVTAKGLKSQKRKAA